ncbi:hypothetical protein K3169_11035 [Pseudomonas phytophila]|uniref:Uncharacterized protein n=1 Tax=Pseudomonas phytophila TaxID=2867264 RepID=A0ABY6FK79_9PSED|nr:hypothetical protein [Pseudomonas phytophila]UXZ98350.1 hypothetical protein K3169_11035 [Pseudomonas phytophila]
MPGLDKWLNRVALFSQILLVIIAIVTVKLTVIPLYQKELSSEELAKAQIQLGVVQSRINELTSDVGAKEKELNLTVLKLQEAERAETVSRANLASVNYELKIQAKNLADLKVQNRKISEESSQLKKALESESQLKFRQALEWFMMVSDMDRNCYRPDLAELRKKNDEKGRSADKECNPYSYIKAGVATLRKRRHDAAGDPLNLPGSTLDKWLSLADAEAEKQRSQLHGAFNAVVFESLVKGSSEREDGEPFSEYRKRLEGIFKLRDDYASKARDQDMDVASKFIRSLGLPM